MVVTAEAAGGGREVYPFEITPVETPRAEKKRWQGDMMILKQRFEDSWLLRFSGAGA